MAWAVKYVITITCDTCGKETVQEQDMPSTGLVPADWIRTTPLGETVQLREFCSVKCLSKYKPQVPEWKEASG
jgi:hypothetical protein